MDVIKPGYHYHLRLKNHLPDSPSRLSLQFHQTAPVLDADGRPTGELVDVAKGTTDEEVLDAMIHRADDLNANFPTSPQSIEYKACLKRARACLDERTADRVARGVKGKYAE